jgi:hypothetical protein
MNGGSSLRSSECSWNVVVVAEQQSWLNYPDDAELLLMGG